MLEGLQWKVMTTHQMLFNGPKRDCAKWPQRDIFSGIIDDRFIFQDEEV